MLDATVDFVLDEHTEPVSADPAAPFPDDARAARRLFARHHRRGRPRRPGRRADRRLARPQCRARRLRLGRHRRARRPGADQQPCGRRRRARRADDHRGPQPDGARGRRRSRHRPRAGAGRCAGDPAGGDARRFQEAAARPARGRDRQSARLRIDRDGRRRLGARALAARAHRPADRRRDPDRRGAQSGQFRRAAGLLARRGDRHQHRDHPGRAGHLLRGRGEHRELRARRTGAARPRAARLHRHLGAADRDPAPAAARRRHRASRRPRPSSRRNRAARRTAPACSPAT